jgi:dihydrofolate synthase/folylpolyglutamate synthase
MRTFSRYREAIDFLDGLTNLPTDRDYLVDRHSPALYIKRMKYFLGLIGNPEKKIKYIHIAGTAGKGTVTEMIHQIILASGKRVGSFSSPPIAAAIERIKVGKLYISPDEFDDIVEHLKPYLDKAFRDGPYGGPSIFEIYLAIAFVYFKKQKCEWVVLEAGLGGRFDATNVIAAPAITAVTSIDYDHTELLGKTLRKIARDKAGIIKRGSRFFTAEQHPALVRIFKNMCAEQNALFHQIPRQASYQAYNKALATAIAKDLRIKEKFIAAGMQKSRLPCRFESVGSKPLIILDGAHNRSKIKATLADLKQLRFRKLFLIIGIAENKDHVSILKYIIPEANRILITRFQNKERKCANPNELAKISKPFLKKGAMIRTYLDPDMAMRETRKIARAGDMILVTGSFFLAGEMRRHWYPEERVLGLRKSFYRPPK